MFPRFLTKVIKINNLVLSYDDENFEIGEWKEYFQIPGANSIMDIREVDAKVVEHIALAY